MRRKRKNRGTLLLLLIVLALIGGGIYLANSPMFERNKPQIDAPSSIYWNLKAPIKVTLKDDTGIKHYKVTLNDGQRSFTVAEANLAAPQKEVIVTVTLPKVGWNRRAPEATMTVEATDKSSWNFFRGNTATKTTQIAVDTVRPKAYILSNSYKITQGGSALVVFAASDDHLKEVAIHTSFGKVFKAEPWYKEGYYAALIAWPVTVKRFRAWVIAEDLAGNRTKAHVPLYVESRRYRVSKIKLSDRFLEGKIADLASQFDETADVTDPLKRFKIINETIRQKNEALIHKLSSKVSDERIQRWDIRPFYPLKNAKKVASFGDHRYYYYKGRLVSESYHMGLDLASVKMAPIRASNPGLTIFADYNGIYGNMPMLDHGLGLYTIYGHCSKLYVHTGDEVSRGDEIAQTGRTGLALGDHLHFGVLVQGIEVRPVEWMDRHWIRDNITKIFDEAKKMVDRKSRR